MSNSYYLVVEEQRAEDCDWLGGEDCDFPSVIHGLYESIVDAKISISILINNEINEWELGYFTRFEDIGPFEDDRIVYPEVLDARKDGSTINTYKVLQMDL